MGPTENTSDAIRAMQERERVADLNRNALARLLAEEHIGLPHGAFDKWRPTVRNSGNIPGFDREFVILCTDGVVAWFKDRLDVTFYGHIQHFTGEVKPLFSVVKEAKQGKGKAKAPSKRQREMKRLADLD